jgi:NAD(P)-dependent dehydrogenase (short-subunit alcohol dehydrogenase family)
MGSIGESRGGEYAYRSSKAALNMVGKTLALDLARRGITVVSISPGWVRTDMGGEDAPLAAETSVRGVRKVIAGLSLEHSGSFFNHDGSAIAW